MGDRELASFLGNITARIDKTVAQMPGHQQYVTRYAPAAMAPRAAVPV